MANPTDIIGEYADLLVKRAGVVELRVLKVGKQQQTYSGFFDSGKSLSQWAQKYSGAAGGIYTTLNKINPACFEGDEPTFVVTNQTGKAFKSTLDSHISHRLWLPMDFDPASKIRPTSNDELARAGEAATCVYEWLKKHGWPEPVRGMSGNGVHLLYAVDIPETPEVNDIVRQLFMRLVHYVHFNVATHTKFDSVNFNPARIWKVYGTLSKKGQSSEERPHRVANCIIPSGDLQIVTMEQILEIAGEPGTSSRWVIPKSASEIDMDEEAKEHKNLGKGDYSTLDIPGWFGAHGKYRFAMSDGKHSVFCPWSDSHSDEQHPKGTDTVMWEADPSNDRKWPVFHCSHDNCSNPDKTFEDLREIWKDCDEYCSSTFDWKKHAAETGTAEIEDMETFAMSDMQVFESFLDKKEILGFEPKCSVGKVTFSPSEKILPQEVSSPVVKQSSFKFDETYGDSKKIRKIVDSDIDKAIENLDRVLEAHADLTEESTRSFEARPGDDDPGDPDQGEESDPPGDPGGGSGSNGGPASMDAYSCRQNNNSKEHVLENLVHISGTSNSYYIPTNKIMGITEVRTSFPGYGASWLKMKNNRLVVEPENLVFDPTSPPFDPMRPHVLNKFKGMPALTGPSKDPAKVEEHVYLMSGEDRKVCDYVLNWLAWPLQHVGYKMPTALLIQGPPGSGKNVFFDRFGETAYGCFYVEAGGTELSSRFNGSFSCKLFVVCNEVSTSRAQKDVKNKLKGLITDPNITIEQKGKDNFKEANHLNMVFLSNEDTPLTIECGDRRFVVLEMTRVMSKKYYRDLVDDMRNGSMRGFIEKLKERDLRGFHPHDECPTTAAKERAVIARMNPAEGFLRGVLDGSVDMPVSSLAHAGAIRGQDLWDAFRIYRRHHDYTYTGHMGAFMGKAEKIFGVQRRTCNLPQAIAGDGNRSKWRGFILDEDLKEASPAELHERSMVFSRCVTENNISDPSGRVEGLNS